MKNCVIGALVALFFLPVQAMESASFENQMPYVYETDGEMSEATNDVDPIEQFMNDDEALIQDEDDAMSLRSFDDSFDARRRSSWRCTWNDGRRDGRYYGTHTSRTRASKYAHDRCHRHSPRPQRCHLERCVRK